MSSKAYSPQQREDIRDQLLQVALKLYSKQGIRCVRLMDILEAVGISKPFFYKFFESVPAFVIAVLNSQWKSLQEISHEAERESGGNWRKKVFFVLDRCIHHREHGLLVMTQEEELWVRGRVSEALYHSFMDTQVSYFEELLHKWGIPQERCSPKVLANLILTIVVTYNSAQQALPFLYLDELERTARAQAEGLMLYLETLKSTPNT